MTFPRMPLPPTEVVKAGGSTIARMKDLCEDKSLVASGPEMLFGIPVYKDADVPDGELSCETRDGRKVETIRIEGGET